MLFSWWGVGEKVINNLARPLDAALDLVHVWMSALAPAECFVLLQYAQNDKNLGATHMKGWW